MKNITILLVSILLSGFFSYIMAQSVQLTVADTIINGSKYDNFISSHAEVHNTGANDINVQVSKKVIYNVPGADIYFCWGTCYIPSVNQSPDIFLMSSGESNDSSFVAYLEPQGTEGESIVEYCFYDTTNNADSSCITYHYITEKSGNVFTEQLSSKNNWVLAYPIPADNNLNFVYNSLNNSNKIIVYNVLGEVIGERQLYAFSGKANMDTRDLENGLYFYSLFSGNEIVSTNKIIISH